VKRPFRPIHDHASSSLAELTNLIEEVQRWETVLRANPGASVGFAAWIERSPQHLKAYLEHAALEKEIQHLDVDRTMDVEALQRRVSKAPVPLAIFQREARSSPPPARMGRGIYAALASLCFLALGFGVLHIGTTSVRADYETGTGEQRRIVLADHTVIELNTQSHVRVSYSRSTREVELLQGEALFNVHHDTARPFRVHVRNEVIEDLGTEFAVYARADASTVVSVLGGQIQIAPAAISPNSSSRREGTAGRAGTGASQDREGTAWLRVVAGEEVRLADGGSLTSRTRIKPRDAASWRRHELWFDNASLSEIATEFNRYNTLTIQVAADPRLLRRRFTASVDPYDPRSFIDALRDDPTLQVIPSEERVVIQPAPEQRVAPPP